MKFNEKKNLTANTEYNRAFWNYAKGSGMLSEKLSDGLNASGTGYMLPSEADKRLESAITDKSVFRGISSVLHKYDGAPSVWAYDSDDTAAFITEGGVIDTKSVADDFTKYDVESYKLATILKASNEFVMDTAFDVEGYLIKRLAKTFAKAEDKAFVVGTGTNEPTGILHNTKGATVGVTAASTTAVTYDEVIKLYFSVDNDYRKNAVWLMNDTTALALRTLKDENGNYLWNHTADTILGKKVIICDSMPSIAAGKKPIAFGDFSYYWIVKRSPVYIKTLGELYAVNGQTGYLAHEFLDGKLIRFDAVKVLKMKA